MEVWNSILDILKQKAVAAIEVKVLYDDIGGMMTLPGDYAKLLGTYEIKEIPFSHVKGNADSEFNNRSHRKILVIDGKEFIKAECIKFRYNSAFLGNIFEKAQSTNKTLTFP